MAVVVVAVESSGGSGHDESGHEVLLKEGANGSEFRSTAFWVQRMRVG